MMGPRGSACSSAKRAALRILMARRRPTLNSPGSLGSNGASPPGRTLADQYLTPSDPNCSRSAVGVTTLPFDFDIFFRSGSTMNPEIAAWDHGSERCSRCDRSTVVNSHVRMMSCACGRTSIGKTRSNSSGSLNQPPAICGVIEEVAQVSMTSGSPTNPPGAPRWSCRYPSGTSVEGSIGSRDSSGRSGRE